MRFPLHAPSSDYLPSVSITRHFQASYATCRFLYMSIPPRRSLHADSFTRRCLHLRFQCSPIFRVKNQIFRLRGKAPFSDPTLQGRTSLPRSHPSRPSVTSSTPLQALTYVRPWGFLRYWFTPKIPRWN
jgi:hypothetical protein